MTSFFSYFAYGLTIKSELFLPEFIAIDNASDVVLKIERNCSIDEFVSEQIQQQALALDLSQEFAIVYVQQAGVFLIYRGEKVTFIPAGDAIESKIRLAVVGTVMAVLLHQRGLLILHASAVEIDGSAMVFLGNSGAGKSSLAAALHRQGLSLVTDDVAAINLETDPPTLSPAFPQLKLFPEVAATLGNQGRKPKILHPGLPKLGYHLPENFPRDPLPLRCIYVLGWDTQEKIVPITIQEAVRELLVHTNMSQLFDDAQAMQLHRCVQLAHQCPVYRLLRPKNLSLLGEVAQLLQVR